MHKVSFDRRDIVAGVACVLAQPAVALQRQVLAIGWRGHARVFQGDTVLDLTVRTRVEPFRRARSTSWITSKGEATARTLVINPTDGWLEQDGQRKSLPPALIAHERQQYGLYGYLVRASHISNPTSKLEMAQPGFPPIRLATSRGRVTNADYTVGSPETGLPLSQHIVFGGFFDRVGQRWFARMTIFQAGRQYFELTVTDLVVERS